MSDELSIPRGPAYRVNRRAGPEPMTRKLIMIAGGLTGALVLIALAWSSVGHHGGQVPVVQADQRPMRVKPVNPGGMQIPGLGAEVASSDDSASGKLAPLPETPDPQGLASQVPPAAPVAAPAAVAPVVAPPVAAPLTSVPARTAPLPPPARAVNAAPVAPSAAPAVARTAKVEPAAAGGRQQVQLASMVSAAAAHEEWDRLTRRMPGLLGSHKPIVSKYEHDGRTLWRLRTDGFATEAQASAFCREVRGKGGSCAVAAF